MRLPLGRGAIRRGLQISGAFVRMDARDTLNYPLALGMQQLGAIVPVVTFLFVSKLVNRNGPDVAGDYYTFVAIGIIGMRLLSAGLESFSSQLLRTINQGRLEMLLVEPIRWTMLPFTMVQWNMVLAFATSITVLLASLALGAHYNWAGVLGAILVAVLGMAASMGVGVLNASVKVLAKRADPILTVYSLAATILSGVFYPIDTLPSFLRNLSWVIPHTYVLQALRRALMPAGETLPGPSFWVAFFALLAFCLVIYPIALFFFSRSMEYGRKTGVLSGY